MLKFKDLTIDDMDCFNNYLSKTQFKTCEYSFTTLYLWRKAFKIQYSIIEDALIIKKQNFLGVRYFMEPILSPNSNLERIINVLIQFKNKGMVDVLFGDIEEGFKDKLLDLKHPSLVDKISIWTNRNDWDYIYRIKDLIDLKGNDYSNKKNHYTSFVKNHNYSLMDLNQNNIDKWLKDTDYWYEKYSKGTPYLIDEQNGLKDLIINHQRLKIDGFSVLIGDRIQGFSIGEKTKNDMVIIHIEKGNKEHRGIYNFINREFLYKNYLSFQYVNREEDLGIEGLREAKESYKPIKLEKKYFIDIKN